jgi:heme exporter protein C
VKNSFLNWVCGPVFACGALLACLAFNTALIFFVAPTEATMGDVQRILYLHVSVAWCGLAGALVMGFCAAMYLVQPRLAWDHWSQAATEIGWLCTTLTLITGSAWAHEAWGTWWTWDPRLTSSLVLWIIYAGIVSVRVSIDDPHRRARIGALLALLGACDAPLVIMATRWFRGVHPVSPQMDAGMRFVLLAAVVCFTMLFAYLTVQRRRQLELSERVAQQEADFWGVRASRQS